MPWGPEVTRWSHPQTQHSQDAGAIKCLLSAHTPASKHKRTFVSKDRALGSLLSPPESLLRGVGRSGGTNETRLSASVTSHRVIGLAGNRHAVSTPLISSSRFISSFLRSFYLQPGLKHFPLSFPDAKVTKAVPTAPHVSPLVGTWGVCRPLNPESGSPRHFQNYLIKFSSQDPPWPSGHTPFRSCSWLSGFSDGLVWSLAFSEYSPRNSSF